MYNIIYDEKELKRFFDIMPPLLKDEVYFLSMSARNKYLTREERESLMLGRTEMFARSIVKKSLFSDFLRTVKKYETSYGSYTTKNGKDIPEKCLVCYVNINPSSSLKAYREFNQIMNEYMFELAHNTLENRNTENITNRIKKMDTLLMNCYQKNRGRKKFMDVDFDIDKDHYELVDFFSQELSKNEVVHYIVDTKSGYHVLLDRDTVKYNFNLTIKEVSDKAKLIYKESPFEIVLNKNEMIPLPGTLQAGHKVKCIK